LTRTLVIRGDKRDARANQVLKKIQVVPVTGLIAGRRRGSAACRNGPGPALPWTR